MTVQDMIVRLKSRTKQQDDVKISGELKSAYSWARNRILNSAGGPDLLSTFGEELTLSSLTREYDLAANLSGTIFGVKQLWLKLPMDAMFTPMIDVDTTDLGFTRNDSGLASDTTIVAAGHPVYYDVINYSKVRFAPPLPSGSIIRVDYYRFAPEPDPASNNALTAGADLTDLFHEAIVNKATAQIFNLLDDDRELTWELRAKGDLQDAIFAAQRRTQSPTRTTPFRARRRRYI